MRAGAWYTVLTALVAVLVAWLAGLPLDEAGRRGVRAGAAVAFAVQVVGFWVLCVWVFPRRRLLAHGLGFALRFVVVGLAALVWMPVASLPAAPTLLSLVGVLSLTTLFEPAVFRIESSRAARRGTEPAAVQ
jgi:uncharacterized membrane protein